MRQPVRYSLRVRGQLGPQWSSWFEGLDVETVPGGDTTLTGSLPDQAALHGLLARVRDIGLTLISVETLDQEEVAE
jgi:hypothetical protein